MSWPRVLVLRSMASSARSALAGSRFGRAQEVRPVEQRLQRAAQLVGDGGQELVLHPARALRLRPHLVLVREQPHVVDRDARVLREQAQDGLAAVGEGPRRPPVHVEQPLHPALHHDRHDQGGDERPRSRRRSPRSRAIAGVLRRCRRCGTARPTQHEAARAAPGLDDQALLEPAVLAGPVAHDDRAAVGLAQGHAGEIAAAQLLGPVDHALEHGAHVVRRVDGPRQLGQHLRLAAAAGPPRRRATALSTATAAWTASPSKAVRSSRENGTAARAARHHQHARAGARGSPAAAPSRGEPRGGPPRAARRASPG